MPIAPSAPEKASLPIEREFVPEALAFVPIAKAEACNALAHCPSAPEFAPAAF